MAPAPVRLVQGKNVNELLIDLDEAFRENRDSYFLGTVVFVDQSDRTWEINDGQQRIVTYSLICARLARVFANGVDPQRESLALRNLFDLPSDHTECSVRGGQVGAQDFSSSRQPGQL